MSTDFHTRILELRKERGLKQKEAAQLLGISQALLSHYENGIRECGLDFVRKCAEFYGVSCDYLLGASDKRVNSSLFSGNRAVYNEYADILSRAVNELFDCACEISDEQNRKNFFLMVGFFVYRQFSLLAHMGCIGSDNFELPIMDANILSATGMRTTEMKLLHKKNEAADGNGLQLSEQALKFIGDIEKILKEKIDIFD